MLASEAKDQTRLVQLGGLEPPTSCSTDRRSNQLSYNCIPRHTSDKTGVPNEAETRCNGRLWQGRQMRNSPLTFKAKTKARATPGPRFNRVEAEAPTAQAAGL